MVCGIQVLWSIIITNAPPNREYIGSNWYKSAVIGTISAIKLKNLIEVIRFLQPLYPGVIFWFVCGQGVKDLTIKSNIYNGGKERSEEFRKKKKKSGNFLDVSSFSLSKVVEFWQKLKPRLDLTKSVIVSQSSETTLSA